MSDFQQDTYETPVIFRKYGARKGGEVIALFPAEAWSRNGYTCSCYVHVGQHGEADPQKVIIDTKAATPAEYASLKHELESYPYGYRLKIYKRIQRNFLQVRKAELRRMESVA